MTSAPARRTGSVCQCFRSNQPTKLELSNVVRRRFSMSNRLRSRPTLRLSRQMRCRSKVLPCHRGQQGRLRSRPEAQVRGRIKTRSARCSCLSGTVTPAAISHSKQLSEEFVPQQFFPPQQQFSEFVPGQSFVPQQQVRHNSRNFRLDLKLAYTKLFQVDSPPQLQAPINPYGDPFMSPQSLHQAMPSLDGSQQMNPYSQAVPGAAGQQFYQDNNSYKHPLNYHLYASVGPRRENMHPYQRASADFFIPDNIRDDLHKKSEAALQVFANSTLPQTVEHFHSLVALDTTSQRGTTPFGYPSWIYKATSSKDGHTYALRRIEGFRLTSEQAIRSFQTWKRVTNSSVIRIHDAFTGRWFGDSSLIVVTDTTLSPRLWPRSTFPPYDPASPALLLSRRLTCGAISSS